VSPSIASLMPARHVVVDGSNIATEGRSLPSLVQLDVAVREYRREFPDDVITVVVDATFGHRIDPTEREDFDEAVAHNEIVSPPAGAIGRGDAFLLRVAEKVGATVLSNDSFQEFHGEHEWLFNNGRLIGGKPVPGVGWIFTPRTPVRGPKSRDSMREARRARPRKDEIKKVQKAIEVATEEAVEPDSPKVKRRRRSRGGAPPAEPVNDPLPFIEFVAVHPLGSLVGAEVESFSSHGAFVTCEGVRCYIPLSGLGDPAPRAAKEVLKRGETRQFVLQALDPPRRGIELALPGFAHVSGVPTAETVEEEIREGAGRRPSRHKRGGRGRSGAGVAQAIATGDGVDVGPEGADGVVTVPTDVVVALAEAGAEAAGVDEVAGAAPKAKKAGRAKKEAKETAAAKKPSRGRGRAAAEAAATTAAGDAATTAASARTASARTASARTASARTASARTASARTASAGAASAGAASAGAASARTASVPETAPAAGPRKRPARPRAGAPRAEPAPPPAPLAPAGATSLAPGGAPEAVPGARKRGARKAAATAPVPEPAASAPVRAPRRRGPATVAPSVPAAPPVTAPVSSTRSPRTAAPAPHEPAAAVGPARATRARTAVPAAVTAPPPDSVAPVPAKRSRRAGATAPASTELSAASSSAPVPAARKRSVRPPAKAASASVGAPTPAPAPAKSPAKKVVANKAAPVEKAAPARKARSRGGPAH